jgi:hypothetical protein
MNHTYSSKDPQFLELGNVFGKLEHQSTKQIQILYVANDTEEVLDSRSASPT